MNILLLSAQREADQVPLSILESLGKEYQGRGHGVLIASIRDLGGKTPSWLSACAVFWRLFNLLRGQDFVHIFVWGRWIPELMAVWLACRLRAKPSGLTFLDRLKPGKAKILWRLFFAGPQWFTAVSRRVVHEVENALPFPSRRIEAIPNGFDPEERAAALQRPRDARRPYVLCLARLRPYKGIDVLLMAWKDVCDALDDVELVLCGPDGSQGRYQAFAQSLGIASRVVFMGARDRSQVWSLLEAARCVVLASRREAFGVAVVEAMACGKAVLATRSGGPQDCLEDGVTGLLVPPQDVEALREGLLRLLREPDVRRTLGEGARTAAARFRWSEIAGSYLNLIAHKRTR